MGCWRLPLLLWANGCHWTWCSLFWLSWLAWIFPTPPLSARVASMFSHAPLLLSTEGLNLCLYRTRSYPWSHSPSRRVQIKWEVKEGIRIALRLPEPTCYVCNSDIQGSKVSGKRGRFGRGPIGVGLGPWVPFIQIPSEMLMRHASAGDGRLACTEIWDLGETALEIQIW